MWYYVAEVVAKLNDALKRMAVRELTCEPDWAIVRDYRCDTAMMRRDFQMP